MEIFAPKAPNSALATGTWHLATDKPMTYGYVRVSTDRQTVENQRFEIARFAAHGGIRVDGWIEETASGTTCWSKRGLGRLLERVREGDLIVCAELSRLGRSLFMIMEILNFCMNRGCRVWSVKDGYRLGDDIQSKVLAFAFGLSAEIERNLISQRTREALARKKAEGAVLGRPAGRRAAPNPLCERNAEWIREQLREGRAKSEIARDLGIARGTLYRFLRSSG